MSWNNIRQEINTNIADNNQQSITAKKVRTTLIDIVDETETMQNEIYNEVDTVNQNFEHYYTKSEVDDIVSTLVEDIGVANGRITDVEDNYASKSYISANYYDKEWIDNIETAFSQVDNELDDRLSGVEDHINESNNIVVGTERKIGAWTEDGVTYDLYEKIVNFGELPNSDMKQVDHGVTNKVKFVYTKGDAIGQNSLSIPFVNDNGSLYIYMGVGNTKITITTNSDRSNLNGYITLRYIRTRG